MIEYKTSAQFRRGYKHIIKGNPELESIFRERLAVFVNNPREPSLGTHKLKGKLNANWAFSLTHKLRVVFSYVRSDFVVLEGIGSHDEVYRQ